MKAAVFTCNTGQGHNYAARAVIEALERRSVDCEMVDALSFLGENASEAITGAFLDVVIKAPDAFGYAYKVAERISSDKRKSPVYFGNTLYAENLRRYIAERGVDTVICPHLFPAEAMTCLKRKQETTARCYFISTDYTCIPFLEETDMDRIFVPHADLVRQFTAHGIQKERLTATGIPVLQKYAAKRDEAARQALGVPEDVPAFLVMTGGEGCGDAATVTKKLLKYIEGDARIFVLPGRNEKLLSRLKKQFGQDTRVVTVEFTDRVEQYMDACDVLLTKPGGVSSTEAAVRGIPIVHTAPIPGCETKNAGFFSERGMSIAASSAESAAENAVRLSQDPAQCERMRQAQRQYVDRRAAEHIAERILADAR